MNGELAQCIALVTYGNRYLRTGQGLSAPDLLGTNSTFQRVGETGFVLPRGGELLDPRCWLEELATHDVRLLSLVFTPNLRGTSNALIEIDRPGLERELWRATWGHLPPDSMVGDRTWRVEYTGKVVKGGSLVESAPVPHAAAGLKSELERVEAFARMAGMAEWSERFHGYQKVLAEHDPAIPDFPDLYPAAGYPHTARRLMAAACAAWVFGEHDEWAALEFAEYALTQYHTRVTSDLYRAVLQAMQAAANAYEE